MKKVKKIRYRCSDCGKRFSSYGEAAGKCSAPSNIENGWPHTVSSEEYFEMVQEGEYDGKRPEER